MSRGVPRTLGVLFIFIAGLLSAVSADTASFGDLNNSVNYDPSTASLFTVADLRGYQPAHPGVAAYNFGAMGACVTSQTVDLLETAARTFQTKAKGSLAGASIYGPACPEDGFVNIEGGSCDQITEDGHYSAGRKKQLEAQVDEGIVSIQCRLGKLQSVRTHLSCLNDRAKTMQQWIDATQSQLNQIIDKAKADVVQIQSIWKSRDYQKNEVENRINGNGRDRMGLFKLKQAVEGFVTSELPSTLETIEEQQQRITQAHRLYDERVKTATAERMMSCFNDKPFRGDFVCGPNAKPTSARNFLICKTGDDMHRDKRGNYDPNSMGKDEAAANRMNQLQALLDEINSAVANTTPILPRGGQSGQNSDAAGKMFGEYNKPNLLNTPDQIMARYGKRLDAITKQGRFNVKQLFQMTIGACYNEAQTAVSTLLKQPGSEFDAAKNDIQNQERKLELLINNLLTHATQRYDDITRELSMMHLPVDPRTCRTAKPDVQIACLKDLKANMENLLAGVGQGSSQDVVVKGIDPKHLITKTCLGITGCLTFYQGLDIELDREVQRVKAAETNYVSLSNKNLQDLTTKLQQQVSDTLTPLQDYMQQINGALSSLGIGELVDFKEREAQDPRFDQKTGIMDQPRDLGAFLGLPNLKGGNLFGPALAAAGKETSILEHKLAKAVASKSAIQTLAEKCGNKELREFQKTLRAEMEQWRLAKCTLLEESDPGQGAPASSVEALLQDANEIFAKNNAFSPDVAVLRNGLSRSSGTTKVEAERRQKELDDAIREQKQKKHGFEIAQRRNLADPTRENQLAFIVANEALARANDEVAEKEKQAHPYTAPPDAPERCGQIAEDIQRTVDEMKASDRLNPAERGV